MHVAVGRLHLVVALEAENVGHSRGTKTASGRDLELLAERRRFRRQLEADRLRRQADSTHGDSFDKRADLESTRMSSMSLSIPRRIASVTLFQPLRIRDFRLLWTGEIVSLLGDTFFFVALPWLTLQVTGSGLALGTVLMSAAIPRGALMLVGGALTDRLSPRLLFLATNLLRGLVVALIGILALAGQVQLWELYGLAVVFGALDALYYPTTLAFVPLLVPQEDLPPATGLMQGSMQLSNMVGPVAAGLLIAATGTNRGTGVAFLVDAGSFAVSVFTLLLMTGGNRRASVEGNEAAGDSTDGILGAVLKGLRYAWSDPVIRTLLFVIAAVDFAFAGPIEVGLASLARGRFAGGASAFGVMIAAFGAGGLIGTLVGGSIKKPRHRGLITLGGLAFLGVGLGLIGVAPNVAVAVGILLAIAFGSGFINVLMIPWLQTRSDPSMLGRVMSLVMFASISLAPVSLAVSGALVDVSDKLLFGAAGILVVAASAAALLSSSVRSID